MVRAAGDLRHLRFSATLAGLSDVNEKGPSPEPFSALATDRGAIGQILCSFSGRVLPGCGVELLNEAARRERQGDNPWRFLLGVEGIAPQDAQVFRAAESQRSGWRRILASGPRLGQSPGRRRIGQGDLGTSMANIDLLPCAYSVEYGQLGREELLDDPDIDAPIETSELENLAASEDAKLVKRHGRDFFSRPMLETDEA